MSRNKLYDLVIQRHFIWWGNSLSKSKNYLDVWPHGIIKILTQTWSETLAIMWVDEHWAPWHMMMTNGYISVWSAHIFYDFLGKWMWPMWYSLHHPLSAIWSVKLWLLAPLPNTPQALNGSSTFTCYVMEYLCGNICMYVMLWNICVCYVVFVCVFCAVEYFYACCVMEYLCVLCCGIFVCVCVMQLLIVTFDVQRIYN